MKNRFTMSLVTGLLILSLCLVPGLFTTAAAQPPDDFVPGEVIVGFKAGIGMAQGEAALTPVMPKINARIKRASADVLGGEAGIQAQRRSAPSVACLIQLEDKSSEGMTEAIAELSQVDGVRFAEPNYIASIPEPEAGEEAQTEPELGQDRPPEARIQRQTNDPMLLEQWGYFNIWADITPEFPRTAPTIAVIDTGVDYTHPDLRGRVIKGPDLVNGDRDPMDDNGHGTHVAGIAGAKANNYIGITGISPTSKIYAIKVMSAQGWGTYYDLGLGIYTAANRSDVKVINLSLGGDSPSTWLEDAVNYAWGMGKVICAAAGNDNTTNPLYPAYYTNCIAVAANGWWDGSNWYPDGRAIWWWLDGFASNYGTWVDISAPGTDIISTVPPALDYWGLEYAWWSGTSMATPHVAAAAARVWAQNTGWTNSQVRSQLETTADWIPLDTTLDEPYGWPSGQCPFGRLNLFYTLGGTFTGKGFLEATVLDGTTGNPVVGATMQARNVVTGVVATDTVPSDGYTYLLLDEGTYSVTFSKRGYSRVTLNNISITEGDTTDLGIIPLVSTARWTLVIVWPTDSWYNSDWDGCSAVLYVPPYNGQGPYYVHGMYWYPNGVGIATAYPYARYNIGPVLFAWPLGEASEPRAEGPDGGIPPMDSISIIRELRAEEPYYFFGWDEYAWWEEGPGGFEGAKAWIFKGRTLVDIVDAPSGTGYYEWDIGTIYRGVWTRINEVYGGVLGEAGGKGFQESQNGKPFPPLPGEPEDIATTQ